MLEKHLASLMAAINERSPEHISDDYTISISREETNRPGMLLKIIGYDLLQPEDEEDDRSMIVGHECPTTLSAIIYLSDIVRGNCAQSFNDDMLLAPLLAVPNYKAYCKPSYMIAGVQY